MNARIALNVDMTIALGNITVISLFLQGYKQVEIMKIVGCSQPQVSRVMKKFVEEYARC